MKNKEDIFPNHAVCNKGLSFNVIRLPHEDYPEGTLDPDNEAMLPAYCAHRDNLYLETFKFFHEVYPASFQKSDKKGKLVLYYAVNSILELAQFFTETSRSTLQSGHLSTHRACIHCAFFRVIKVLCEKHSEGIKTKKLKGLLTFHLAVRSLFTLTFLHELLD